MYDFIFDMRYIFWEISISLNPTPLPSSDEKCAF